MGKLLTLVVLCIVTLTFSCSTSSDCDIDNPKCNGGVCSGCSVNEDCALHSKIFSYCNSTRGYCYSIPPPYPPIWGNQVAVVVVLTILHIGFIILLIIAWRFSRVSSFGVSGASTASGTSKTDEATDNE